MAFSSAISIEKYATNLLLEFPLFPISLALRLSRSTTHRVKKPAPMNLLLSGNLTAQASKEENFVFEVFPRKSSLPKHVGS